MVIVGSGFMTNAAGASSMPLEISKVPGKEGFRVSMVGNLLANYSDPAGSPPGVTGNNRTAPEQKWEGTSELVVAALDDFRRLGLLDLSFNHPRLLPGGLRD